MPKVPGDTFAFQFPTFAASGALTNADSLPTATLVHNGVDDGTAAITVANVSTGLYKASGTIPSGYSPGDDVQVRVNATVGGVASGSVRDYGTLDAYRLATYGNWVPPVRNQDAVTAPTFADCLLGAWTEAFAKEPTLTTSSWVKQKPDNSGPARTFSLTTDTNGNVNTRS